MFGDKTALGYSSAFDRINVRRLFLVIEREIAKISRTTMFNERRNHKNTVQKQRQPLPARFRLKRYVRLPGCMHETNNTPEVIDRNEFIADIYIKPARSINFITLNFVATKTANVR